MSRLTPPRLAGVVSAACLVLSAGCGGGGADIGSRQPVFPVSGTVTYAGTPLSMATIAFSPQDGQPTAFGKTDVSGRYQLTTYDFGDGAAAGNYKVVVNKTVSASESADDGRSDAGHGDTFSGDGDSHAAAQAKAATSQSLVPPEYASSSSTPLTADVKSGEDNVIDLKL